MSAPTPNGEVQIRVGIPSPNGQGDWTVTLEAQDSASRETLFVMELTPADWLQVQRGLVHRQEAFVGTRLGRVGKRMEVESVRIPREALAGVSYGDEEAKAAKRWAEGFCSGPDAPWAAEGGPEEWSTTRHNYGWGVHMRRWVDPLA